MVCILSILLAVSGQAISADLEELSSFSYGDWSGGAYQTADGRFSHCHIASANENGIVLAIALTGENEINLLLVKASWELSSDTNDEVRLLIDGEYMGHFRAIANDLTSLEILLGDRPDIFEKLRLGNEMVVDREHETISFSLKGTNKALGMVKECVESATSNTPSE